MYKSAFVVSIITTIGYMLYGIYSLATFPDLRQTGLPDVATVLAIYFLPILVLGAANYYFYKKLKLKTFLVLTVVLILMQIILSFGLHNLLQPALY